MKTFILLWLLASLLCVCTATETDSQKTCWDQKYTYNSCYKVFCDPWRRCVEGRCVCKLPYQCPRNVGIPLCAENEKIFNSYCHLKSSECSNSIHRVVSNSPCQEKLQLYIKKKNGNTTSNNGLLKIKLPTEEKEFFVCSKKWTIREANVACRQLDFPKGASGSSLQYYINKKDQKQTECLHITCRGTETSLVECILKKGQSKGDKRGGINCYKEKESCTPDEFTCVNEKCISKDNICNGENDCGDLSDEMCCSQCKGGFHCNSDVCIPKHFVCNGEQDCLTGEDEVNCQDEQPGKPKDEEPVKPKDTSKENTNATDVTDKTNDEEAGKPKDIQPEQNEDVQPKENEEDAGNDEKVLVDAVNFDLVAERKLIKDHLPKINCGIPKQLEPKRVKRIIGGDKATENQFPWQVAIKEGSKVNCGGIYIGGCWVLTAAHCVRKDQAHKYFITIEMLDRLSLTETVDTFPVKSIKVHEHYVSSTYENDIALLEVTNIYRQPACMQVNNNIVPACVPWSPYLFKAGDTCVVSGWGREEGFGKVFHLKWGHVNLMNNCSEVYKNRFFENMECAGTYDGSIDACKGDSGGPLVCYDANNVAYVWGIVSWGENCGVPGYPGVYTKVANYFEWICRQIGREGRALITKFNN